MRSSAPSVSRPRRRQTLAELRQLQRLAGKAIMRPLTADFETQPKWDDGRDTDDVISTFIKPNDRLTAFERLEIYNKQYWYRLIDNLYEDFRGLLAILGQEKFSVLTRAYLAKYPSRSFTLRNLGRNLPKFIQGHPKYAAPYEKMAIDMARFEWAQVVAFDAAEEPSVHIDDLLGKDPNRLRLGLQPYLTVLEMAYPLDVFSLALKKNAYRAEASNAMDEHVHAAPMKAVRRPRPRRTFVAVHRRDLDLYFLRLEEPAFRLLSALSEGKTITQACHAAGPKAGADKIQNWFANWAALGWFCKFKAAS